MNGPDFNMLYRKTNKAGTNHTVSSPLHLFIKKKPKWHCTKQTRGNNTQKLLAKAMIY